MWPMLIGAALGAGKGMLDKQQEQRDRQAAAVTQQWSPWTGLQAGPITKGDVLGGAMQGGLAGAGVDQGMDQQAAQNAYLKNSMMQPTQQPSPWSGLMQGQQQPWQMPGTYR